MGTSCVNEVIAARGRVLSRLAVKINVCMHWRWAHEAPCYLVGLLSVMYSSVVAGCLRAGTQVGLSRGACRVSELVTKRHLLSWFMAIVPRAKCNICMVK